VLWMALDKYGKDLVPIAAKSAIIIGTPHGFDLDNNPHKNTYIQCQQVYA
jgi:hypothetical protein